MKHLLAAGLFAFGLVLSAYDVNTKALAPVKCEKAPEHESIPLVRDGKIGFTIIADLESENRISETNRTQKSIKPAVEILCEAFEKCTGTRPVVRGIKDIPAEGTLIIVGDCAPARDNGVNAAGLPSQGFQIRTFPRGIIIAGNDSSLIKGYNSRPLEMRGSSRGTEYGAYDFVERFLGVRYYFPGEYGTLWPKIKELILSPVSYSDAPCFDTRNGIFYLSDAIGTEEKRKTWEPYLGKLNSDDVSFWRRWRMGDTIPGGGSHCPRPEKIAAAYPDRLKTIFYTSPTGNFYYNAKQHIGNQFDVVNFGFADLFVDSLKKYYDSDGKIDEGGYFDQGCNRSYVSFGICDTMISETDVANHPVVRSLGLMTEADQKRGPESGMRNVFGRFHQYLANRIAKEIPGCGLYIMAYYNVKYTGNDPRWRLPANVEVNLCDGNLPAKTRNPKLMRETVETAREWYETLGNRPVQKLWLYDVQTNAFVKAITGEMVGDIPKIMGKYLGRTSLFFDHNSAKNNLWFFFPSAYCAYRSMWNPDFDCDAAMDELYGTFFGPEAGPSLVEFHRHLKQCYLKYFAPTDDPTNCIIPEPELAKLESLLNAARKAVKPGSVEAKRLALLAGPWDEAIQSMRNRISYEKPVTNLYRLLRKETVSVDGSGSESFWAKIKPVTLSDPKGSSAKPAFPASVKLAWSDSGIYGLCETKYAPKAEEKCDVWNNDSYEVIFSPGLGQEVVYQFAFDPRKDLFFGTQRLLPIPQPFDEYWKAPGFRMESKYSTDGWTAEFYIPFSVFGTEIPKPYDTWLFNIVRNKMSEPKEYSGSCMTLGLNRNLNMFGILKFAGKGDKQ